MGKCAPQTFPNFTADCISALMARIRSEGVSAPASGGDQLSGTASRAGFEIAWTYDPEVQALTVQCTSAPFFAPCSLITSQINSWVTSCYPGPKPTTV